MEEVLQTGPSIGSQTSEIDGENLSKCVCDKKDNPARMLIQNLGSFCSLCYRKSNK